MPYKDVAALARRLCVLLRLVLMLHRYHHRQPLTSLTLRVHQQRLELRFPTGWLDEHPLNRADLKVDVRYLQKASFRL